MAQSLPAQQQVEKLSASCSVCRGPAAPHLHYGAVCCYSCRAFFRRGVARDYECVAGTNSCVIDTVTRRNCQKCRFNRCLFAGMRPDWVDATLKKKYYNNNKNNLKSPPVEAPKHESLYWQPPPQYPPSSFSSYPYPSHHQAKKEGYEMVELMVPVNHLQYKEVNHSNYKEVNHLPYKEVPHPRYGEVPQQPDTLEQVLDIVNTEDFTFAGEREGRKRSMSQRCPEEEEEDAMHVKKIFLEPRKEDNNGGQDYEGFEFYDDSLYNNSVNWSKEKTDENALTFFGEFAFLEENNVFDSSTSECPDSTSSSCSSTATTPRIMLEDTANFVNIEALVDECFAQELLKQTNQKLGQNSENETKKVEEEERQECLSVAYIYKGDFEPASLKTLADSTYNNCNQLVYLSMELNNFFKCLHNVNCVKRNFWINFGDILGRYQTPSFVQSVHQFVQTHFQFSKRPNKKARQMLKKITLFEKLARNKLTQNSWALIVVFLFFNLPYSSFMITHSKRLNPSLHKY